MSVFNQIKQRIIDNRQPYLLLGTTKPTYPALYCKQPLISVKNKRSKQKNGLHFRQSTIQWTREELKLT